MRPNPFAIWLPFAFAVVLTAIAMITFIATGSSDAWIPAFVCFLPMTFWFAAAAQVQTRDRIKAMEARIEQLEAHPRA